LEHQTGKLLFSFWGHTDWVLDWVFAPDGKTAFSSSLDKTIRRWDLRTGRLLQTFEGLSLAVNKLMFTPDGKKLIAGQYATSTVLIDVETGQQGPSYKGEPIGFLVDDRLLLCSLSDSQIVELGSGVRRDFQNGRIKSVIGFTESSAIGYEDNTIKFWNLDSGAILAAFANPSNISSLALAQDDRWLVGGDQSGKVWIFEQMR
jgi:WD40 repeat protein